MTIHLNQVCWSKETSKTCKTAVFDDQDCPPLAECCKVIVLITLADKWMCVSALLQMSVCVLVCW